MSALAERVDKFFKITERGSTLRIELWAAVANFRHDLRLSRR